MDEREFFIFSRCAEIMNFTATNTVAKITSLTLLYIYWFDGKIMGVNFSFFQIVGNPISFHKILIRFREYDISFKSSKLVSRNIFRWEWNYRFFFLFTLCCSVTLCKFRNFTARILFKYFVKSPLNCFDGKCGRYFLVFPQCVCQRRHFFHDIFFWKLEL